MRRFGGSGSLTARLLTGVALPMAAMAMALGAGGAFIIREIVGSVNDRVLDAAARGIADSLTVEDGVVAINLSPVIFGMLENTERDNVYYSLRQQNRLLSGYDRLPEIRPPVDESVPSFGDGRYLSQNVRIVARLRRLPGFSAPVVIEVAETLDAREADTKRLLIGLAILETALIVVATFLLPISVRWGLRPLRQVRSELDQRADANLTPVSLGAVPSELRDLVRAFNAMLGRLDDTLAAVRRFTANASHQMRTPLSILRVHIAVLRDTPPGSAEAIQSIDDIDKGAARLSHLISQLLALARADNAAHADDLAFEIVDLRDIVAAVVDEHRDTAAEAGVTLEIASEVRVQETRTSVGLAIELLSNLIDNAIRHGGPGGSIRIGVIDGPGIIVEDDGPGIPQEQREHVFARFVRLRRHIPNEGSGLGLSIARSLAQAIGAEIELGDAQSGSGLRVVVRFPPLAQP